MTAALAVSYRRLKDIYRNFIARTSTKRDRRLGIGEQLESREMFAGIGEVVPNFALRDVNTTSDRFNEFVSPRDYLGQVSVWYFAHST